MYFKGYQTMRKTIRLIIGIIIIMTGFSLQAQLKSQLPRPLAVEDAIQIPPAASKGSLLNFIDPDRFFMNQSYSLTYSSYGGGMSMGIYQ
ncbi:MAG: hypothetical protein DRP96_02770, partial [Candidatus Neomarinimicrobiota bacterium]